MSDFSVNPGTENDPSEVVVEQALGDSRERVIARTAISPSLQSALTIKAYGKSLGELELMSLVDELRHQIGQSIDGNLDRAEAMLTTQAHTLDAIFNNLAQRAIHAEYLSGFDTYLKLGLRAQSQCRATWETLATIKNPMGRAIVGQANFANNQQVINDTESSRARETQNPPNELLEETNGERLDGRTPQAAVRANRSLEAVGTINRTTDTKRQG